MMSGKEPMDSGETNDSSKGQVARQQSKPPVVVPIGATLLSILMAALLWGGWVFLHSERDDTATPAGGSPAEEVQKP